MDFAIVPIGAGEVKTLPRGRIREYSWGSWLGDGKRVVLEGKDQDGTRRFFVQEVPNALPRLLGEGLTVSEWVGARDGSRVVLLAHEGKEPDHLYLQEFPGGTLRPFGPHAVAGLGLFSPDGRAVLARPAGDGAAHGVYPIDGTSPRPLPGLLAGDEPRRFSADGRSLFVSTAFGRFPVAVTRIDLASGRREAVLSLAPPERAGVILSPAAFGMTLTGDGSHYAYMYVRWMSDLYLVEGLK
jgi:hypothetical protein